MKTCPVWLVGTWQLCSCVSGWPRSSALDTLWLPWAASGLCVELGWGDADLWFTLIPYHFHVFCIWLKKCNQGWDFHGLREAGAQVLLGFHTLRLPDAVSISQNPSPRLFHHTWKPRSQFDAFKCKKLLLCSDGVNVNSCENVYQLCEPGPRCVCGDVMWSCCRRKERLHHLWVF